MGLQPEGRKAVGSPNTELCELGAEANVSPSLLLPEGLCSRARRGWEDWGKETGLALCRNQEPKGGTCWGGAGSSISLHQKVVRLFLERARGSLDSSAALGWCSCNNPKPQGALWLAASET